jgi:electron transfer flavoprotein beta subunit
MRIYVCVKHVPDTAANIKIVSDTEFNPEVKYVPNPYDEYGVEQAIQIVEKQGEGEIIAVCVGGEAAVNTLRSVMAMGVHRSILVKTDEQLPGTRLTAKALAKAITADGKAAGPADLIFTGKQSVDAEGMQTPYWMGEDLKLPVVTGVMDFSLEDATVVVKREIGDGSKQSLSVKLPCIIGATKGLNEPRFPKLPAILKAKKKEIRQIDIASLDIAADAGCCLKHLEAVTERSSAKILEGSVDEVVNALVKILREEEKVI